MTVEVVAVEERMWSGSATLVSAQTTEGEIGIMPGHAPVLGQLVEGGIVSITTSEGERRVAAVHGGFLAVTGQKVSVLAETADWSDEIDADEARRVLDDAGSDEVEVARARGRLKAVERA
ncbi:F0F1 ATP synthase subunit epsilon [Tomitella fengzijianii]|uniref:ATP synthase epsilon chain n=2 Tax=Tomitella fengzijianii TaxID=2597660 RepID=A0A516X7X4_9ACTN|nr:F0F1 ATP synthase subunit epsilon [Tomitella fengzijianii]